MDPKTNNLGYSQSKDSQLQEVMRIREGGSKWPNLAGAGIRIQSCPGPQTI